MYVGKNPFCFAQCMALRAMRGAKQQGKYSEFRKIQSIFPHVLYGLKGLCPFKPDQWWNNLIPVKAIAIPYLFATSITLSSRTEPPGSAI